MKQLLKIIVIALLCQIYYVVSSLKTNDIRNHLGTRTPYRFRCNKNDSKIKYPGCKDVKIWMIVRHGTRYPSPKDILGMNITLKDMKYLVLLQHSLGRGNLSKEQRKLFEDWSSDINVEEEKFLTLEGQDEMILLAERMHKRFPNAIKLKYDSESFLFRYTATQRAQQSAVYFVNGLFNIKEAKNVLFHPAAQVDPLLRFYKHCDKWQKQVKRNKHTYREQALFAISKDMNNTLKSVTNRLGFHNIMNLDTVNLMYKACGYETAWYKHYTSPWCFAFDEDTIKTFEYYNDLKQYWMDSYGHDLTYRQACVSIKNMFDNFSDDDDPHASFLFAHSGTILKILSHMELYKPERHLTGDALPKHRTWSTSNIDCFGANLAFVLFKCKDGDHVLTLHHEHIIKLPMCETELCPLKHLRHHFHKSIYNCNYTDMCKLDKDDEI